MPTRTKRICTRCRQTIPPGPCPTCDQAWTRKPDSWAGGSTRRWRRLRQSKLDANLDRNGGLCEHGCGRLAAEVHHEGGFTTDAERYDWHRLRALCPPCHADQTAAQSQAARRGEQQ
ncbi:hypothetical protein [Micromonospora sp. DT227]|uniref:hypothetical protein n=1 Tax=Micromonospora sp. DT227 TaxID=3393433 RepID=UPI003CF7E540